MIAYLSSLLAQAENAKDASQPYHDIHTLRTQLQAIQAVTKAQQAHQQEKAQLVQQQLNQRFDQNSMQILDGHTHVNAADTVGVKLHQAKKTRTTSEETTTSTSASTPSGSSYESIAFRYFDVQGIPSNGVPVQQPEIPITTISSNESVPSLPSQSAPFDLPLQAPAVPMQFDSEFIPGSPFEQGMFPSSESDHSGGLLYGQDMDEPETDFAPWSPVHVPEPISQEQLEAEQREYELQMQRLAATKHDRATSSTSSSGSAKSSIILTVTPPAAATSSPHPMTGVHSNHVTPHQPQSHNHHGNHDRVHSGEQVLRNGNEIHTPHTTNSASTSSSEGSAPRQTPSLSSQGPIIQGFSGMSKVFLANYLSADVLSILEREYGAGNFSAAAVRQHFMWMTASLEPEEQAELLVQFRDMQLHKSNPLPCPRKDVPPSLPSTTWRTPAPGSVCHAMSVSATPAEPHYQDVATPSSIASSRAPSLPPEVIRAQQAALMKAFGDDLSPQNAAADDLDGVARVRITILFSVPPATAAVVAKAAQKRKKLASTPASSFQSPDDAPSANPSTAEQLTLVNYSDNDALVSKNNCKVISTTASPGSSQQFPDFHTHRCIQVNQAFERLTGYTQREMMALIQSEDSRPRLNQLMFKQVRSDHLAACHRITMKWRLSSVSEGHMYQVRIDKSGKETYCIVHLKVRLDQGMFLGGVQSIIPLPDDPSRPPPPFIEGVDLDEETLLYGYRPPNQQ